MEMYLIFKYYLNKYNLSKYLIGMTNRNWFSKIWGTL